MNAPAILHDRSPLFEVRLWVSAALACSWLLRLSGTGGASRLWFLDPLLLAGLLIAVRSEDLRRQAQPWPGRRSVAVFVGISWLAAMLYELSLSGGGGKTFGGLASQTMPSFALAQGFYVPLAMFGLLLVRRYDFTLRQLFFAAGAVSVFEMVSTGTVASLVTSPFFLLTPLVIAYYFTVYALFICWPVALFGIERFRGKAPRPASVGRKIALGVAAGAASWMIFGGWGSLLAHLSHRFVVT